MSYLESVRDRLREEYEEHMEKQTTKSLHVVSFHLQLKTTTYTARQVLHHVDPLAPIPQVLEGGDGNGPLYLCVLREKKVDALQAFCESNQKDLTISSEYRVFLLAKELYTSDSSVEWKMGTSPTVCSR